MVGLSRSEQMARIRGRDTRPEQLLRGALWRAGLRYRLHYRLACGRPDLAFPGARVAVFIDGCFWHGCPEHYIRPRARADFWSRKLRQNVERDIRQTRALQEAGWKVERFWEHEIFTRLVAVVERVRQLRYSGAGIAEPGSRPRVIAAEPIDGNDLEKWTLVDLFDPGWIEVVERMRTTTKW